MITLLLDPKEAIQEIGRRLHSYEEAQAKNLIQQSSPQSINRMIEPIVFNILAAFQNSEIWIGIICTNRFGPLLAAWPFPFVEAAPSPEQGELEGLIKTAELEKELRIQCLHL